MEFPASFSAKNYRPSNLVDLLRWRASQQPDRRAFTFLLDAEEEGPHLSYLQLDRQARAISALLQTRIKSGERALLLYPPGLEFVAAFFGCLYSGIIAVPVPPPDPARLDRTLSRVRGVCKDAQPVAALTTSSIFSAVQEWLPQTPDLQSLYWLATDDVSTDLSDQWQQAEVSDDSLAFLQYTSGSTAAPKGVMVSHANLLNNSQYISQAWEYVPDSVSLIWVPNYHDDGLVHGTIQPIYSGYSCLLMSPVSFAQKPARWLEAITRHRVTHSGGPNFAYALCVRKVTPHDRANIDLSSWRMAYNAAEPIHKKTLEDFYEAFAPCGFRWDSFYPSYGLAESTLLVSTKRKEHSPSFCVADISALERQKLIVESPQQNPGVRAFVGCGHPVLDMKIAIVDSETLRRCATGEVGEIWLSDRSVAQGYWNQPEATEMTFRAHMAESGEGPFLRTRDLGFMKDGELFVTGRLKDLLIIRGRNIYPQDIELTVEKSHPALRPGCGAAFAVEANGEERLVIVHEVDNKKSDPNQIIEAICQTVAEEHELPVYAVALIKPKTIPKTSSGKIQRHACQSGFLAGNLDALHVWSLDSMVDQNRLSPPVTLDEAHHSQPPASINDFTSDASRQRADELITWLRGYADERINSRLIDERRSIPPYIVLDFGNRGLLGMQVPEAYGGLALGNHDMMRVLQQMGAIDLTLACFVVGDNALGIRPIQYYADTKLREELLPILAAGRELSSFALTEPGAGSNPRALQATATPDGWGGWRLRGTKIWSGTSAWAGVINVFVQLSDGNGAPAGITGFVVRQGAPGLRIGPEALTMGVRGMVQNTLYLEDVPVSPKDLLGTTGAGLEIVNDAVQMSRLCLGAVSIGGMKRCAQLMLRYSTQRAIATGRLLDNPVSLARLSNLAAATEALQSLVTRTAQVLDRGASVPAEVFMACKNAGAEFLWKAADDMVQMLGGRGYIESNLVAQMLRDARLFRIFEGPTETLNMFIGTSVIHSGQELDKFLRDELSAAAISHLLKEAGEQIKARCLNSTDLFSNSTTALRWAYAVTGEIAMHALLWAAALTGDKATQSHKAAVWAQAQFEMLLQQALDTTPAEQVLLDANAITALVSDYAEHIGDIEQARAGEDHSVDGMLARHQPVNRPIAATTAAATTAAAITAPEKALAAPALKSLKRAAEPIEARLIEWLSRELGLKDEAIDIRKPFSYYGVDSITGTALVADIQNWIGRPLSPTLVWVYPTIEKLALHLAGADDTSQTASTEEHESDENLEALLNQIEQLSDEEARVALDEVISKGGIPND
jgi:acyl-CoA synthetase (AMP-forming)/AMP-acid ligase II/alkylation response protein AidB-like acyl-CoA dehydrogenase/acyl carrier protein